MDRPKDERRVRLGQLVTRESDRFVYAYDFGGSWAHTIVVEKIFPTEPGLPYPRCVAGKHACPPEDVGGMAGYADFLEAIRDPAHRAHGEMLEWSSGSFDPEAFDIEGVNRRLG